MNDFDALLEYTIKNLRGIGIPVPDGIEPHVRINWRAVTRFGCCTQRNGVCTIELSGSLLEADERACLHVLAHEVLHSCPGCRNHGKLWQSYAERVNAAFGYGISRTARCSELGVPDRREVRYLVECSRCGAQFKRMKASPLVLHPEQYRCRCGGRLVRKY